MSEQAPGPWTVQKAGISWFCHNAEQPTFALVRATKEAAQEACDHENDLWRQKKLRDAAPELLNTLVALVNFARPFGAFRDDMGQGVEAHCTEVIAKATGMTVGDRTDGSTAQVGA